MKIIILFISAILSLSCSAQVNIKNQNGHPTAGTYYKDLDHILDSYVGTYLFTDGTTSLKFVFQKKAANANTTNGISYTEDLLFGEYRYVKDNVEQVNTLDALNINMINARSFSFWGNTILQGNVRGCTDCSTNETRVLGYLLDSQTKSIAQVILRKKVIGGQEAIVADFWWQIKEKDADDPEAFLPAPFPGGEYIMYKQ